jgi:hypothetical protein
MAEPETHSMAALSARDTFTQRAWPALSGCVGCHGSQPSIDFLAPGMADKAYETLFTFQPPVIDVGAPSASLLVTMGKHTGPALATSGASAVIEWLTAERDERFGDGGGKGDDGTSGTSYELRVGPFMPQHGVPIQLDTGINGASLTVVTEPSEGGLYFKRITLTAGSGIKMRHPLFVSRPAHPIIDEIDRFSEVDVKLAAGATLELGPAWFLSFTASEYMSIHFQTLEAP